MEDSLLRSPCHREEEQSKKHGWCACLSLDRREAKLQASIAVPMIFTNLCVYSMTLVPVMFAGHLGDLELAGSTLANSWAFVSGFALLMGLSGALETLCGQGYGAKTYRMLGIYLQSSIISTFFVCMIVSVLWFYAEPILILLHQDAAVSRMASLYLRWLIPGIYAYAFLQCFTRFLQTQSIVLPLVLCSIIPLAIEVAMSYFLVYKTSLGFKGAAVATSVSFWLSFLLLVLYVNMTETFQDTWQGISMESLHYIFPFLKLAISSAVMVCAAVSTRVSNEIGAGNPQRAKNAVWVTLKLSVGLGVIMVISLATGHKLWASAFSGSQRIKNEFASMTMLLASSILLDAIQGVLSGVARGCGWQHLAAWTNLAAFYGVGVPIAVFLAFKLELHAHGLWLGLICGLFCQVCILILIMLRSSWSSIVIKPDDVLNA
ncbi:protein DETOXIFICATION 18 isoform X3 [Amborella trichopoda]|uniref:protein DETOXIFICATION 18 isoform X3 n=1 Tax=Amborella trichopoda TaxID=13333 RepID=UPI0009BE9F0B|nr:protein DETOXIFICATION 18 isoform X3 [Amborella trichopoda]|eukprot:XP_020528393.1 protein DETOXIFICATION 18 isoform X3 [Amborella trichopoda]